MQFSDLFPDLNKRAHAQAHRGQAPGRKQPNAQDEAQSKGKPENAPQGRRFLRRATDVVQDVEPAELSRRRASIGAGGEEATIATEQTREREAVTIEDETAQTPGFPETLSFATRAKLAVYAQVQRGGSLAGLLRLKA